MAQAWQQIWVLQLPNLATALWDLKLKWAAWQAAGVGKQRHQGQEQRHQGQEQRPQGQGQKASGVDEVSAQHCGAAQKQPYCSGEPIWEQLD